MKILSVWDDFNPWKDRAIYIDLHSALFLVGEEYILNARRQYGNDLDFYLLPGRWHDNTTRYSFGIRYGYKGSEYLSPYVSQEKADLVYHVYKHGED